MTEHLALHARMHLGRLWDDYVGDSVVIFLAIDRQAQVGKPNAQSICSAGAQFYARRVTERTNDILHP